MKTLLTLLLMIGTLAAADTVHYDKQNEKNDTVHYGDNKTDSKNISKPNHPSNSLYGKK
ncbi:hypothetical protein KJ877_01535 [bacterium]|nr:hypothetical protein [bacterium]MBU1989945.1 hypothetical protein [bacterium]